MNRIARPLACALLLLSSLAACGSETTSDLQPCRTDSECDRRQVCENGFCVAITAGGTGEGEADADAASDAGDSDTGSDDAVVTTDTSDTGEEDGPPILGDAVLTNDIDELNACGGTAVLEGEPDTECGPCGGGTWVCDGLDAVACASAQPRNACGGCDALDAEPGGSCSCGDEEGDWACDGENAVVCECDVIEPNGTCAAPFPIELGDLSTINLCGQGDDVRAIAGEENCGGQDLPGEDAIYLLDLEEPKTLLLTLWDSDAGAPVDVIASIRTTCDDPDSQLICADDAPCEGPAAEMGGCVSGSQPRWSELAVTLEVGEYFIIVDQFTVNFGGTAFRCGEVTLSLEDASF